MLIDLLEISGVAFSVFSAGGVGVFRFKNRKRRSPEWRQDRLAHFMLNVDLDSTCEKLGHVLFLDGSGCMYCNDILKAEVHWYGDKSDDPYSLMTVSTITKHNFLDPDTDERITEVVCTKKVNNHTKERWGYITIDPHVNFTPESHNHKHETVTKIIKKHFDSTRERRAPVIDKPLDTRHY